MSSKYISTPLYGLQCSGSAFIVRWVYIVSSKYICTALYGLQFSGVPLQSGGGILCAVSTYVLHCTDCSVQGLPLGSVGCVL